MEKELLSVNRRNETIDKENNLKTENEVMKFKNISIITIALSIIGLVLHFSCSFVYQKTGLGITIFIILVVLSVTIETININKTLIQLKGIDSAKIGEVSLKLLRELYQISFIVFFMDVIGFIFIVPFFYNANITINEYLKFIPTLLVLLMITVYLLRVIAHLRLKNNSVYQYAEKPFNISSKKYIILLVIFFIITFDTVVFRAIIIPILIEYIVLISIFFCIVSLFNIELTC
jgi:hypothetical protein